MVKALEGTLSSIELELKSCGSSATVLFAQAGNNESNGASKASAAAAHATPAANPTP